MSTTAISHDPFGVGQTREVPFRCYVTPGDTEHMMLYVDDEIDSKLGRNLRGLDGISQPNTSKILMIASEHPVNIAKGQKLRTVSSVVKVYGKYTSSTLTDEEIRVAVSLRHLSVDEQTRVLEMIQKCKSLFSASEHDTGMASVTEHKIKLTDSTPIFQRPRRLP